MKEISFIGVHTHFCKCRCDERMIETVVKMPHEEKTQLERQCRNCGRKYKVNNISIGTMGE